jgi:hypothetical protein
MPVAASAGALPPDRDPRDLFRCCGHHVRCCGHHVRCGRGCLTSSGTAGTPAAAARAASPRARAAARVSSELIGRGMVDGGGGRQRRQWRCSGGGGGNSDDSGRNKNVSFCFMQMPQVTAMRRVSLLRGSLWELVGMCTILRGQASCLNVFYN